MRTGILIVCCLFAATPTLAQDAPIALTEETEPRRVGTRATTTIGVAGFVDRTYSSEELLPFFVTVQIDVGRFLTDRIAVRGGVVGQGRFGGDTDPGTSGPDAAALHANVGALFYLTPASMISLYGGLDYRAQLTDRRDTDLGFAVPKAGVEALISSRASFFGEAGFGIALRRGSEDELNTRIVAQVGFRVRF